MNHTPGPWKASARNIYSSELNVVIAQCWDIAIFTDEPLPVEANVRLVAAAPALLAACEAMISKWESDHTEWDRKTQAFPPYDQKRDSTEIKQARAAIAAARPAREPVEAK